MKNSSLPKITIFTPTYNRAKLIHRVYDSLIAQKTQNFEWLIIDDGSTDNTAEVVQQLTKNAKFTTEYIYRENRGKVYSINEALNIAKGEFFLVFDSDDWCSEDALVEFISAWEALTPLEKEEYSGVSCLKAYQNGEIVGEDYKRISKKGASYVDRFNKRIKGDKWEFIKTDIHRENCYRILKNDRYMAPEYAWLNIGKKYKTIFLNKPLGVIEYQEDGISKNNLMHRVGSANSTCGFYLLAFKVSVGAKNKIKSLSNYIRFSFHAHRLELFRTRYLVPAIILGAALYAIDSYKLNRAKEKNGR